MSLAEKEYDESGSPYRYTLTEKFARLPQLNASIGVATNLDFEVLGTNADNTVVALDADGGITCTTKTSSGDQVILVPHLDTAQSAWAKAGVWGTENSVRFEATIKTGANITSAIIWAGLKLTNTSVVATDDDQAFFRYEGGANSGAWTFVHSRSGTDTTTITNVTVAVSTTYRLVIEIDSARQIMASINGVQCTLNPLPVLTDAVDLIPYVGVQTAAAAAKAISVRAVECSRAI